MTSASVAFLLKRAAAGERIYVAEALRLYEEAPLADLQRAASVARQVRVPGRLVTYLLDQTLNYTNVCSHACRTCAFHRAPDDPAAFLATRDELVAQIDAAQARGCTRLLLQGGHHPDLPFDWYTDLLRWLRARYPTLELEGFTPATIRHLSQISGLTVREVLRELRSAGLQGLASGGTHLPTDSLRDPISPRRAEPAGWLHIMREAQRLGMNTAATLVIGFDETPAQRVRHMQRVRDLQSYSLREYGQGFSSLVGCPLQHQTLLSVGQSPLADNHGATVNDYLRHAAIARLFLDNIPHQQVNWASFGLSSGQRALAYGLDDFGSTSFAEHLLPTPTGQQRFVLHEGDVHTLIREAGYVPALRDSSHTVLRVFSDPQDSPQPVGLLRQPARPISMQRAPAPHPVHLN